MSNPYKDSKGNVIDQALSNAWEEGRTFGERKEKVTKKTVVKKNNKKHEREEKECEMCQQIFHPIKGNMGPSGTYCMNCLAIRDLS